MIPNLQTYITLATNATPQSVGPISATEVKFISHSDSHFVSINGTTATTTSFLVPQDTVMDVIIPFNTTLSIRTESGQGHFTVAH